MVTRMFINESEPQKDAQMGKKMLTRTNNKCHPAEKKNRKIQAVTCNKRELKMILGKIKIELNRI